MIILYKSVIIRSSIKSTSESFAIIVYPKRTIIIIAVIEIASKIKEPRDSGLGTRDSGLKTDRAVLRSYRPVCFYRHDASALLLLYPDAVSFCSSSGKR